MTPNIFVLEPYGQAVLAGALCLDLFFGDPEGLPHPVRLMGRAIERGEDIARSLPVPPFFQGIVLTAAVAGGSVALSALLLWLLFRVWPPLYLAGHALLIYYGISVKCLALEARGVAGAILSKGVEEARVQVSRIVGRDTSRLDEAGVVRAAIESVAENLVDGVASPLFFAALGGGPLCMAYKAVNTLDSMIGYRDDRYREFGKAAARLDDLVNYLPARLTALVVCLASPLCKGASPAYVWRTVKEEGRRHDSPNSGWAEAAFAAALGIRLSGPARYREGVVDRPYLHPQGREPGVPDIVKAIRILNVSALLMMIPMFLLNMIFGIREQA